MVTLMTSVLGKMQLKSGRSLGVANQKKRHQPKWLYSARYTKEKGKAPASRISLLKQLRKLAAKIMATDSFVFVNRLGSRVLEKRRTEFAHDMQRERIRILENDPMFD